MCMNILYMYIQCLYSWGTQGAVVGINCYRPGIKNDCELSCGCWRLNFSPLRKQPVAGSGGANLYSQH